jgi:hypothetical protein
VIPLLGERYRVRVSGQDTAATFAVLDTEAALAEIAAARTASTSSDPRRCRE